MESSHRGEAWGWVQVTVRVRMRNLRVREVFCEWIRKQCRPHLSIEQSACGWAMAVEDGEDEFDNQGRGVGIGYGLCAEGYGVGREWGSRGEEGGIELAGAHH